MLDLCLAIACSLAIGIIFKIAARRRLDRMALLAVNYGAATLLAATLLAGDATGSLNLGAGLLALGGATGALFILGFFVFALAVELAGLSLAVGVMRLAVVLPFLASWFIWGEVPSVAQGVGLAIAGAAFFLIAQRPKATEAPSETDAASATRAFAALALLFCAGGLADIAMKAFDETYAATNAPPLFLLMVFGVAFVIGSVIVVGRGLRTGAWPSAAVLGWGITLGLVNYGSAAFILGAIRALSGPFVFPANNIALVIGSAIIGVTVWGEHLTRVNWLGLGLAATALVLLNF